MIQQSPNIVLLAGGKGSRLWPLSIETNPKQFITLPKINLSSFQVALLKAFKITRPNKIIIVTNLTYKNLLAQQLIDINLDITQLYIIYEEISNNTGIASYLSCLLFMQQNNDQITYFFPTDHMIAEPTNFFQDVIYQIDQDKINLFAEETQTLCSNFGYLAPKKILSKNYFALQEFIEKPDVHKIKELKQNYNNIYKNLGIYLAKPSILYQEFCKFYPDLPTINLNQHYENNINIEYSKLPIDKMISERSSIVNFIDINFSWQDLGSIQSLYNYFGSEEIFSCAVDSTEITKFNETHEEFNLELVGNKMKIKRKF